MTATVADSGKARPRRPMARPRPRSRPLVRAAIVIVLVAWTLIALFPYYVAAATSIKSKADMFRPLSWDFVPTLDNYTDLFTLNNFGHYLLNSAAVALGSVLPSLVLAIVCVYGLTRFGLRKERSIALTVLSLRMVPAIAVVIPFFLLAQWLHLIDTTWVLMIAYTTFNLPFAIWMLRGFFREIPMELDEAAQLDGASRWRILLQINVPIAMPAIGTTAILMLIQSWNEFVFAQFLTTSQARTFPTSVGLFLSIAGTDFGQMAAASIVGTAPVLVFAFVTQKRLTQGLAYGAI